MQLTNLRTPHALAALTVAFVAAAATVAQTTAPAAASRPTRGDPGPSPTLGAKPPALAGGGEVLFDGGTWTGWHRRDGAPSEWMPLPDGSVQVRAGDAITDETFTDFQLHLEFFLPDMGEKTGQARANSGVYLHGRYEVQVLDTYGIEPAMGGCGAIYSISPPMVTANRPADTWQTYDIIFRAPRFDGDGRLTDNPFATVLHNGVVIHNNLELPHTTPGGIDEQMVASGPLLLQDHGDPIRYRNIWIRRLD